MASWSGRVNLTQVRRDHFHSASLGYRIAPSHSGQGLASEAVKLVMQKAFLRFTTCNAWKPRRALKTPPLIRVLLKNGFQQFGHSRCSLQLHRQSRLTCCTLERACTGVSQTRCGAVAPCSKPIHGPQRSGRRRRCVQPQAGKNARMLRSHGCAHVKPSCGIVEACQGEPSDAKKNSFLTLET